MKTKFTIKNELLHLPVILIFILCFIFINLSAADAMSGATVSGGTHAIVNMEIPDEGLDSARLYAWAKQDWEFVGSFLISGNDWYKSVDQETIKQGSNVAQPETTLSVATAFPVMMSGAIKYIGTGDGDGKEMIMEWSVKVNGDSTFKIKPQYAIVALNDALPFYLDPNGGNVVVNWSFECSLPEYSHNTIPWASLPIDAPAGQYTVTATDINDSDNKDIAQLEYVGVLDLTSDDVTSPNDSNEVQTIYVPAGKSFTIKAKRKPESSPKWPDGKPTWTLTPDSKNPPLPEDVTDLVLPEDADGNDEITLKTDPKIPGGMYTIKAQCGIAHVDAEKAINVSIYKIDGIKVYDPKLDSAGNADYTIIGGIQVVLKDSTGVTVACSASGSSSFSWDGKWGKDENGNDTVHKGKFADPGKYDFHAMHKDSEGNNVIASEIVFSVYVVRLGVTEIAFEGNAADEYFPLQFQATKKDNLDDGISQKTELYPLPAATWRIGDETSNAQNADITSGANAGKRRESLEPYVNYTANNFTIFHPPLDASSSADIENDTWNYPVCYKQGSKIRIKVKPSSGAYSQVQTKLLKSDELGFSSTTLPQIKMMAKVNGISKNMTPDANAANITPSTVVTYVDDDASVKTSVGCETKTIQFTWSYKDESNDISIPGKMETQHTVYSIVGKPNTPWSATVRPWISALHYATEWANGAKTQDQIADKITEKVNSGLGVKYDTIQGGNNYGYKNLFYLSNFTLFLNGAAKIPVLISNRDQSIVNCSDCSVVVTTFANIAGGGLSVSHIDQPHALNEIIAVGGTTFPYPNWSSFSYHAFTSNSANKIWDACLKVRDGAKIDPTDPASGNDVKLPMGMPHKNTNPATATSTVLEKISGSEANGVLTIVKVYQEDNHNGVVPASCSLTCTAATATTATFTLDCGRNGTLHGITLTGASVNATLLKDGIKIIDFKLEKGTKPFLVGDKFTFELKYDFSDYRSSLAAPDWKMGAGGTKGRTPAGTKNNYDITILR